MLIDKFITFYTSASFIGFLVEILLILVVYLIIKRGKNNFAILFESMYEKAYDFFVEILGKGEKMWIKTYIVALFFIILFSNLLGITLEIIAPIFGMTKEGGFILEYYISIPSGDINFNLSLAIVSIFVILYVQFSHLGLKHFVYDYFPIYGKNYITMGNIKKTSLFYYPMVFGVKAFDIIISLFLGILEIIGILAKIISLSFRLFGNMTSGTILLAMAVVGISSLTTDMFGFNFPIGLPVLIYLQEILVAFIQALVFPLLVAIFIKVATTEASA